MLGSTIGSALGSAGLGMLLSNWEDKRQVEQQQRLQDMQIKGQQQMGRFNQGLALDMWEKTNFEAQRKHLEKAGLNVGLMYAQGGPGGTTATPTGNVTGATAQQKGAQNFGMGMQLALQTELQKATIALTQAQANKAKVEADKLKGVDTEKVGTEIQSEKIRQRLMDYEAQVKEIERNIKRDTEANQIQAISEAANKATADAKMAEQQAEVWERTKETVIRQIDQTADEQLVRIAATKAGILKTGAETSEIQKQIELAAQQITKIRQEIPLMHEDRAQRNRELSMKENEIQQKLKEEGIDPAWITVILQMLK